MRAFSGAVAALLSLVLEFADHSVDLVVGHPPDQRREGDADDVDVV
jgi:hypothetical protein